MLGYAFGDWGGYMTFAIMGSFLTPYYTEVAGISPAAVATMFLVLKIWDAINDPMMGAIMDRAFSRGLKHRLGKFRPWMLRAAPLLFITSLLMFTAPTYVSGVAKVLVAFVTYLLYEASYTMFNIPYGALLSAMSNTDKERASLSSARGFGSIIGNLIPLMLFPIILEYFKAQPQQGYVVGVSICAAIGLVCCLLSVYLTTERNLEALGEKSDEIKITDILQVFRKNRAYVALCLQGIFYCIAQYFGTTLGIYMFRDVLGALPMMSASVFIGMGVSVLFLFAAPLISARLGLERTVRMSQLIGIAFYLLLFALMVYTEIHIATFISLNALAQGFTGMTVLMQWGMVGEAIDYNEYLTGKRTEGSIYGTFNLMRRVGQAIGTSGSVALLGVVGYVPKAAVQTASALFGIKLLVVLVPAIFVFLCYLSLRFLWNITDDIRAQMAEHKLAQRQSD